jgi:hypothetical protein
VTKKTLYTDPRGKRFIVGVIRDITERKRLEEERQIQQQQMARPADDWLGTLVSAWRTRSTIRTALSHERPVASTGLDASAPILEAISSRWRFRSRLCPYSGLKAEIPRLFEDILTGARRIEAMSAISRIRPPDPAEDINPLI